MNANTKQRAILEMIVGYLSNGFFECSVSSVYVQFPNSSSVDRFAIHTQGLDCNSQRPQNAKNSGKPRSPIGREREFSVFRKPKANPTRYQTTDRTRDGHFLRPIERTQKRLPPPWRQKDPVASLSWCWEKRGRDRERPRCAQRRQGRGWKKSVRSESTVYTTMWWPAFWRPRSCPWPT